MSLPALADPADVTQRVKDALGDSALSAPKWAGIVSRAAKSADATIYNALLPRRYSPAAILASPTIPDVAGRLGMYYALLHGAVGSGQFNLEALQLYADVFAELKEDRFPVLTDAAQQSPDASPGPIPYGRIKGADLPRDCRYPGAW